MGATEGNMRASPNEGKNDLEQTKCIARVLMVYSPKMVGDPISEDRVIDIFLQSRYDSSDNCWVKIIRSGGREAYVQIRSPLEEGGKSQEEFPDGARIVAELDLRQTEKGLLNRFKIAISQLENQAKSMPEKPSPHYTETVNALKNTLKACDENYNRALIVKIRNSIKESWNIIPFQDTPNLTTLFAPSSDLPTVPLEALHAISNNLSEMREQHCADAFLYGSIKGIVKICTYCYSAVQSNPSAKKYFTTDPSVVSSNLAVFLTSAPQTDPDFLLMSTVLKAIKLGFISELLDIVTLYRETYRDKIEQALKVETTDQSLDLLYEATPFSFVAKVILYVLKGNVGSLGSKMNLVKGAYKIVNEDLTLLRHAVANQVLDFYGEKWKYFKEIITWLKRTEGELVAKKYVDYLVERSLFYPRKFKSELLDGN